MLTLPILRRSSTRLRSLASIIGSNYASRFMICLAISLAAVLALVHAPIGHETRAVGWYVVKKSERLSIDALSAARLSVPDPGVPAVRLEDEIDNTSTNSEPDRPVEGAAADLQEDGHRKRLPQRGRAAALEFAQEMPAIEGGLGAYYVHIEYPEAALRAGIEGRLVLTFIVETTGHTRDIEVIESLHPLCDSAAVRALRQTHFIPGRHNGERVPVRMRLPVRFRLVEASPGAAGAESPTARKF